MNLVTCEIYIAMNEDGGYVVGKDETDILERLAEDEGGWNARIVKVEVRMAPPTLTIPAATVEIGDDVGKVEMIPQAEETE